MIDLLTKAIQEKSIIEFDYDGGIRIVEPHCHGLSSANNHVLRAFQIDGYSSTGRMGWKLYDISKVVSITVHDKFFVEIRIGYSKGDKGMKLIYHEL